MEALFHPDKLLLSLIAHRVLVDRPGPDFNYSMTSQLVVAINSEWPDKLDVCTA